MNVRELIIELIKIKDLDTEVKIYSLTDMEKIDKSISEFEFVSDKITEIDINNDVVYICGEL